MNSERLKLAYMVATPDILSEKALGYHGDIKRSAALLKSLGYDGIELTTADPSKFDWDMVKGAVVDAGLDAPMVCSGEVFGQSKLGLACPREEIRKAAIARLKHMIEFAAHMGSLVNIGRSRWYYEEGISKSLTDGWALEAFLELADYAKKRSVVIALEPIAHHVCNFINSTQDGLKWVDKVASSHFKQMLDMYHMNIEDELTIEESIGQAVAAEAAVYVHLCDSNRKPPGWGHINFASIMQALKKAGYKGYVSGEVLNYPDQDAAVKKCSEVFRPLL